MIRDDSDVALLQEKLLEKSMEKLRLVYLAAPGKTERMSNPMFDKALNEAELSDRKSLKSVVTNFRGNHRCVEYEDEIKELLMGFRQLRPWLSVERTFCCHTWTIFQWTEEIWVKSRVVLLTRYSHYGRALIRPMGFKLLADCSLYSKLDALVDKHRWKYLKIPFIHE